jgi:hypothetical protein
MCGITKDFEEARKLAIESLERDIGKKPINFETIGRKNAFECPCCDITQIHNRLPTYCEDCGQKIDWN